MDGYAWLLLGLGIGIALVLVLRWFWMQGRYVGPARVLDAALQGDSLFLVIRRYGTGVSGTLSGEEGIDGRLLVKDLSVELPRGRRLLILGPSGSGRTTLLRAAAGLWSAGQGRVAPSAVAENQPVNTTVGTLSTTDQDVADTHSPRVTEARELLGNRKRGRASGEQQQRANCRNSAGTFGVWAARNGPGSSFLERTGSDV